MRIAVNKVANCTSQQILLLHKS